jgi:hypothetical protein
MDAKTLAAKLDGREYTNEITREEEAQAKAAGLVVAFGASDDLLELRGAIHDETYPSDSIGARVDVKGIVPTFESVLDDGDKDALRDYFRRENGGAVIRAVWAGEPGYSWIINTDVPHETFEIVEDGEPYCRGIVFALADITA